jgi:AcrR family transcriptional regulator
MPALQQAHPSPPLKDEHASAATESTGDAASTGRRAAGEDPVKREQIIDGAKRVFMATGFDAASMNDITREAGVSKGTIYVYFDGKEDLFAAMIERERARVIASVKHALHANTGPMDAVLQDFGITFVTHMCADQTVRGMKMALSVSERMPALCQRFFSATPENGYTILRAYLEAKIAEGLLEIEDTDLASRQFIELCMPGLFKRRLFGWLSEPPGAEEIEKTVRSAIRMFLRTYGVER